MPNHAKRLTSLLKFKQRMQSITNPEGAETKVSSKPQQKPEVKSKPEAKAFKIKPQKLNPGKLKMQGVNAKRTKDPVKVANGMGMVVKSERTSAKEEIKTQSGKRIFNFAMHPGHMNFTPQDHLDASNYHQSKRLEAATSNEPDKETALAHHWRQEAEHNHKANLYKSEQSDSAVKLDLVLKAKMTPKPPKPPKPKISATKPNKVKMSVKQPAAKKMATKKPSVKTGKSPANKKLGVKLNKISKPKPKMPSSTANTAKLRVSSSKPTFNTANTKTDIKRPYSNDAVTKTNVKPNTALHNALHNKEWSLNKQQLSSLSHGEAKQLRDKMVAGLKPGGGSNKPMSPSKGKTAKFGTPKPSLGEQTKEATNRPSSAAQNKVLSGLRKNIPLKQKVGGLLSKFTSSKKKVSTGSQSTGPVTASAAKTPSAHAGQTSGSVKAPTSNSTMNAAGLPGGVKASYKIGGKGPGKRGLGNDKGKKGRKIAVPSGPRRYDSSYSYGKQFSNMFSSPHAARAAAAVRGASSSNTYFRPDALVLKKSINKSAKHRIMGMLAAGALHAGTMHHANSQQLTKNPAPKFSKVELRPEYKVSGEDQHLLGAISQVESSGGKNMRHSMLKNGMHAGSSAMGRFGIMPKVAAERYQKNQGSFDSGEHAILKPAMEAVARGDQSHLQSALESNKKLDTKFASLQLNHIKSIVGHNASPEQLAHAWNQGPHKTKEMKPEDIKAHPYVQAFNKNYK